MKGKLLFEGCLVARLTDVIVHQGTWFADYHLASELPQNLMSFIEFSRDVLSEAKHTMQQLNEYVCFLSGRKWHAELEDGTHQIDEAPLFRATELSWVE